MSKNTFEQIAEDRKNRYMVNVRKSISDWIDELKSKNLRIDEKDLPSMNSYERNLFYELYTNEELVKQIEYYLSNAQHEFREFDEFELTNTYSEQLKHRFFHILLKRFKELIKNE